LGYKNAMDRAHFNEVGVVFVMKCCVYTKIKRKEKIMVAKWDFIEEHASKKRVPMINRSWIQNVCM
jgi:hypothetical protein